MGVSIAKPPPFLQAPDEHARLLHPAGPGLVVLARRDGRWQEQRIPVEALPERVRPLAGCPDVFLTQNRFNGPRRIAHLVGLDALWADLDYHRLPQWAGWRPEGIWELALDRLEAARIPAPTLAIATGRGLCLLWVHSPVPRQALPRWNACQRTLYDVLKPLGADRMALDAARVLRLIGTVHGAAGQVVRALTPVGRIWPFDALADEILPLTRREWEATHPATMLRRDARRPLEREKGVRGSFFSSIASLWEARLDDFQTLLQLRWFGRLPPGQRDLWLFLAVNAMSWLAPPEVLLREAWALAHQVGGWDEREAATRLQAIFKRARMAAQGQTVEWQERAVDPRYAFRTATIIEWLDIKPDEQRHLRTLIGPEEKRRRHREAERARKWQQGETQQSRAAYLAQAAARREEALRLRAQGYSLRQIAHELKVSLGAVQYMLHHPSTLQPPKRGV